MQHKQGPRPGGKKVHCKQNRGLIGCLYNKRAVWSGPGNTAAL